MSPLTRTLERYQLTCQTGITETDYRVIIDGLEEEVDLTHADDDDDDDEDVGPLSVFQVIQASRERSAA